MHPILDSLTGTQFEVVRNLLFAFNAGDIARFESLIPEIASTEVSLSFPLFTLLLSLTQAHHLLPPSLPVPRVAFPSTTFPLPTRKDLSPRFDRSRFQTTYSRSSPSLQRHFERSSSPNR